VPHTLPQHHLESCDTKGMQQMHAQVAYVLKSRCKSGLDCSSSQKDGSACSHLSSLAQIAGGATEQHLDKGLLM
jgi:hypothetical protein